jgi:hypothetical protein
MGLFDSRTARDGRRGFSAVPDVDSITRRLWLQARGGVKGGIVHGRTDEFGCAAIEDKVHYHDLHATILYLLDLDQERLTFRYSVVTSA